MTGRLGLAALAALLLTSQSGARADDQSAFARQLDRPAATKVVKAASDADTTGQITCTYYADLMVRETGTDTPDPADAVVVPLRAGATRPPCGKGPIAGAIAVKTEGFALDGRKGGFLIWDASDPNGAEPFLVIDAQSGRILFQDALSPSLGLARGAALDHGVLRLTYTHGQNAPCSIVQDPKGCWSTLVKAGQVPRSMPPLTAAPKACLAAYKATPASDPSVVTFAVEVVLDQAGKTTIVWHGAPDCQPQP